MESNEKKIQPAFLCSEFFQSPNKEVSTQSTINIYEFETVFLCFTESVNLESIFCCNFSFIEISTWTSVNTCKVVSNTYHEHVYSVYGTCGCAKCVFYHLRNHYDVRMSNNFQEWVQTDDCLEKINWNTFGGSWSTYNIWLHWYYWSIRVLNYHYRLGYWITMVRTQPKNHVKMSSLVADSVTHHHF